MKIFKIISFNIIIIAIMFVIVDFIFFYNINYHGNKPAIWDSITIRDYIEAGKKVSFDEEYKIKKEKNYFRDVTNHQNTKKPILIFGCSIGYGYLLNNNQSFGYKLSELTNRNVYNRSISSLGIQYFPYILEYKDIEKEIPNPEYIIYVFIDDHIYRLMRYYYSETTRYPDIRYKYNDKTHSLELIKNGYIGGRFFIVRYALNKYARKKYLNYNFDKKFDFMKQHFMLAKEIANKKFPNSKIVILRYEDNQAPEIFTSPRWKELENEGFIVLDSYELTGKHLFDSEYKIENNNHPNERAWDLLTPKILEKLNL